MAIGIVRNVGGGSAKPKQIFLYKNGTDNTELTGGLSRSGYSFTSGYTERGEITFDTSSIKLYTTASTMSSATFGTTNKVDLTNYKSIIVKAHNYNAQSPTEEIIAVDISNLSGGHYIAISISLDDNSTTYLMCHVNPSVKSPISSGRVAVGQLTNTARTMAIDSIELIPWETMPDNIIVDSNQQFNHKYTLQGNASIVNAGVVFTRPQSTTLTTGYIHGIDFTNINSLTMSYTSGSSVYIRLNGDTLTTIASGASGTMIFDVSEYSGVIPFEVVVNNYASFYITTLIAS